MVLLLDGEPAPLRPFPCSPEELVAADSFPRLAFAGKVLFNSATQELVVRVARIPAVLPDSEATVVACSLPGSGTARFFDVRTTSEGGIEATLVVRTARRMPRPEGRPVPSRPLRGRQSAVRPPEGNPTFSLRFPQRTLGNLGGRFHIPVAEGTKPYVVLALPCSDLLVEVTSPHLSFAKELGPGPETPTAQARRVRQRLRDQIEAGAAGLEERGGRFFLESRLAAVLFELPVEVLPR